MLFVIYHFLKNKVKIFRIVKNISCGIHKNHQEAILGIKYTSKHSYYYWVHDQKIS